MKTLALILIVIGQAIGLSTAFGESAEHETQTWDTLRLERLDVEKSGLYLAGAYYTAEAMVCAGTFKYLAQQTNDEDLKIKAKNLAKHIWFVAHLSLTSRKSLGQRANFINAEKLSPLLISGNFSKHSQARRIKGIKQELRAETYELLFSDEIVSECIDTLVSAEGKSRRNRGFSNERFDAWSSWVVNGGEPPKTVLPRLFEIEPIILERYPQLDFQTDLRKN